MKEQHTKNNDDIIDSIADGLFTVDNNWKITGFNYAAEMITGISKENAIGKCCSEIFHSNICGDNCALKKTMETGEPIVNKSLFIINSIGLKVPISISTSVIKDKSGKIIGGVETFRDLSLEVYNERIKNVILSSIADGVFTVDKNWKITSFNKAAEEITGTAKEKAIGSYCHDIFHSDICEENCALKQTMRTGESIVNKSLNITSSCGSKIPISTSTSVLKDDNDIIIGGVETFRDLSTIENLRKELNGNYSFNDIIGRSHLIRELFNIVPQIAESNSSVLIEGPSGTGKEMFAKAIHNLSLRQKSSFVAINCGALPDTLLESELFGYKAGAFTGAKKDKPGRFALANGGTLFLDEIGDISHAMQVRLLRVLQEKEYEPLGSIKPEKADVRIVAATNKSLQELVYAGDFREDLYYRINVVKLELPSLKDRLEDVPLLVNHFIDKYNKFQNKQVVGITDEALRILMMHNYPGNVRELENIIEHSFVICSQGLIDLNHLPDYLRRKFAALENQSKDVYTLKELEKIHIINSLKRNKGNKTAAAKEMGINSSTLFRKLKSLKISD